MQWMVKTLFERFSRALATKNPFTAAAAHGKGKQLKDCAGLPGGEGKKCFRCTKNPPHGSQDYTKEIFYMRCLAFLCAQVEVLYQIKNDFLCWWPSNFIKSWMHGSSSKKHGRLSFSCEVNRKGQKRIFFVPLRLIKKRIFIIFEPVFIVLMLIRCIVSLLSWNRAHQRRHRETEDERFV